MADDKKPRLSLADLDQVENFQINAEKAVDAANAVLAPNKSRYVALVDFFITDPDEKTGDQHGVMVLSELDLAKTLAARRAVPLEGSRFEMQAFQFAIVGGRDKKGEAIAADKLTELRSKAGNRTGGFVGTMLRSAGVKAIPEDPNDKSTRLVRQLAKALSDGSYPVGIFNPSTNGPALMDSYTKDSKMETVEKKDFGEVNFAPVTPERYLEHIGAAAAKLEKAKAPADHTALLQAMAIDDVREYAKLAKKQSAAPRLTPGGQGGGFNMGDAPPDSD